jgi:hypothetical protein
MALNFPAKIYQILENESNDIIRWLPNGAAFRIVDHSRFEREIIPKYFRHNQISSVQRQLNLYGFKCVSRGEDKGAFFHPKFRRGDWEIVKKITRYAPIKKPDDLMDPTRPDEQMDGSPVQVDNNFNNSTPSTSSTNAGTSTQPEPHSLYQHHISAQAFQSYANTYHRPYDPFGYNEIPPFISHSHQLQEPPKHPIYATGHRPPAWAWNGGPVPSHYANNFLHMKQTGENNLNEYRQSVNAVQQTVQQTTSQSNEPQPSSQAQQLPKQLSHQSVAVGTSPISALSTATVKAAEVVTTPPAAPETTPAVIDSAPVANSLKKSVHSSFVNVVNDVVFIDPDFDLDEEFDFFDDVVPAMKVIQQENNTVSKSLNESVVEKLPRTSDIGINTDISQASLLDFYSDM